MLTAHNDHTGGLKNADAWAHSRHCNFVVQGVGSQEDSPLAELQENSPNGRQPPGLAGAHKADGQAKTAYPRRSVKAAHAHATVEADRTPATPHRRTSVCFSSGL